MRLFARNALLAAIICNGGMWASDAPANSKFTTVWKFRGLASAVNGLAMHDGKAYGVVTYGGPQRLGTVIALSPPASGKGAWTEETLYTFANRKGGYWPTGNVSFDDHGALYGVTGGECKPICEAAFQLKPPKAAGGAWTYAAIHEFSEGARVSSLTWHDGSLYGTTSGYAPDAIFQLTRPAPGAAPGSAWRFTQIQVFTSQSDPTLAFGVVFDKAGALYGVGQRGGAFDYGAVFQLAPPAAAGGQWTATVLYSFTGGSDGGYPSAGLVLDENGALYGTTGQYYGSPGPDSQGTIFRLAPPQTPGGAWTQTTLYTFQGGSDGFGPNSTLVFDASGALYGTAAGGSGLCPESNPGGQSPCGTVFRLAPPAAPGGDWTKSEVENFNGGADGLFPSGVVFDDSGALIGSTSGGEGQAFLLIPPPSGGSGAWTLQAIYNFAHGSDGTVGSSQPGAIPFAVDDKGALYVPASGGGSLPAQTYCPGGCGAVVRLTPPAKPGRNWTHEVLYRFQGGSDGADPSSLLFDKNGILYGNTLSVPAVDADSLGTIFQLTPPTKARGAWVHTVLYTFAGPDGVSPTGPLTLGDDGSLYGAAAAFSGGGPALVFQLVPPASPGGAWTENTIYNFEGSSSDSNPDSLTFHDGALYGTTLGGSANSLPRGNVFKLTPPATAGAAWTLTVLYAFTGGADGANPDGNLVFDHGAIYGTVSLGGPACAQPNRSCGLVYGLTPPAIAGGAWTEAVLYQFQSFKDGGHPNTLTFHNGALQGTTFFGGTGRGTLFQLTPPAGDAKAWTKTVLHDFRKSEGIYPQGLLLNGGTLYGICGQGGIRTSEFDPGGGTLFEYTF
jgi:hypothetical protein